MTDFDTEVEKLADSIEQLDEYDAFESAAEEYENNEEAQELLIQIRELENNIQIAHQEGEDLDDIEDKKEKLNNLYKELQEIEVVQEYNQAAEELGSELEEINRLLSNRLGVNFAEVVLADQE